MISNEMKNYFENLEKKVEECYKLADKARALGKDPELKVEIPLAEDMASRVEQIIEISISKYIRELLSQKIDRETVAIMVAKKVAEQYKNNREYAINKAVRTGLAILTEGILVAPLEGITDIKIGRNEDNSEYLSIYFSGPIRSAGGTAQAMSVLIADIVRKEFGISAYNATLEEIERYKEEIQLYSHEEHLQYVPTSEEIETVVKNCKVCIDGEGTIEREISGYRNLPRVQTNRIRGGMCLVLAEGIVLKSRKIKGIVDKLKIDGWDFLEKIIKKGDDKVNVEPSEKFIEDVVGGRPVFSHPSAVGGFRLRYGRSRTGGLATIEINPATMVVLDDFIAIGTQLKLERPGKAGGVTICDSIEGPIVLLKNGDLIQINTVSDAKKYKDQIARIIDVGEILIGVGEFLENNHPIIPSSFNEDWWKEEIINKGISYTNNIDFDYIWELAVKEQVPLHPKYTLFWHDVQVSDISFLRDYLIENSTFKNNTLFIKKDDKIKNILIELCALHKETDHYEISELGKALIYSLGLEIRNSKIYKVRDSVAKDSMSYINELASVKIYPRALSRIGARMGRPEKAAERKMDPPVHALFPIGDTPHHKRSIKNAAESNENNGEVEIKIGIRKCPKCN
ncbi:MAG: DNA polymerase II large subunit, partial [Thermoplasmata archaeon]